jgi:hypothetical protein
VSARGPIRTIHGTQSVLGAFIDHRPGGVHPGAAQPVSAAEPAGLEVDFSMLTGLGGHKNNREFWGQPLPLALVMLALTLALAMLSALGLQQLGMVSNPMLMGLILSTTSLGVVAPVLKERRVVGER